MILIDSPIGCTEERKYCLDVIFKDWLGLEYQFKQSLRYETEISCYGSSNKLVLPDVFFGFCEKNWLKNPLSEKQKLPIVNIPNFIFNPKLSDKKIPVIFGNLDIKSLSAYHVPWESYLPLDVFGSTFYMLTCYEEACSRVKDNHDRFPGNYSLAKQNDFHLRPIIDEYVEILWVFLSRAFPLLQRKKLLYSLNVTCDLDHPFYDNSANVICRRVINRLIGRRKNFYSQKIKKLLENKSLLFNDPFFAAIEYIMDVNEYNNNKISFFLISKKTNSCYDRFSIFETEKTEKLINYIFKRGHEIGVHPGYDTYNDKNLMLQSIRIAKKKFEKLDVLKHGLNSRQHYLRWSALETPLLLEKAGIKYDSSLGYADLAGFRCGTSKVFPLYDLLNRRKLNVLEKPLIVMESSVLSKTAMNLGYSQEALEVMLKLKQACKRMGGIFTLLWHNSYFICDNDHVFYERLIEKK